MSGSGMGIALSGLDASQVGLDVVSQNISNANTPGYIAETANFTSVQDPLSLVGGGVQVASVSQLSDQFQKTIELNANAQQSYATQTQSVLNQVMTVFQEPATNGISEQLANFWSSFDQVANNPTNLAARAQVISNAQNLANTFNQDSNTLANLSTATVNSIQSQANSLTSELSTLASLNGAIHAAGTNSDQTLIDQQNALLDKVSSQIGATIQHQSDGTVNVLLNGVMLVQGNLAQTVSMSTVPATSTSPAVYGLQISGTTNPQVPSSGSVGALLNAVNNTIPFYQTGYVSGGPTNSSNSLYGVASTLASLVNNQQWTGDYLVPATSGATTNYNLFSAAPAPSTSPTSPATSPTPGMYMFSIAGSGSGQFTMSVNSSLLPTSSPTQANPGPWGIAAANSTSPGAGDGTNAQTMAEFANSTAGPDAAWAQLSGQIGLDVSNANAALNTAQTNYQSAYQADQAVSGVQQNQQMVNMVNYQQSYQAAAKLILTLTQTVQSLLAAV